MFTWVTSLNGYSFRDITSTCQLIQENSKKKKTLNAPDCTKDTSAMWCFVSGGGVVGLHPFGTMSVALPFETPSPA